jgi:hypothetical protein
MAVPNIVTTDSAKGSSHPLVAGSFYSGIVTSVDSSGRVEVKIPALGTTYGPVTPVGTTELNKLSVNDVAVCTFTDEFVSDIVVFGSGKIKADVFASKATFDQLVSTVNSLAARVTALENA